VASSISTAEEFRHHRAVDAEMPDVDPGQRFHEKAAGNGKESEKSPANAFHSIIGFSISL
jgi:hypothetical protein